MENDEILMGAGDAEEQPPEPAGGIPPQTVPGWVRWPLRAVFLPFVLLDLGAQWTARRILKPPFRQEGQCKKRGNCCYYILIPESKGLLKWINLFWNTEINGFYFRDYAVYEYEGMRMFVMGCRYLKKDGSCKHYRLRPAVCRKWPMIEQFGYPRILKGCGYRAALRHPPPEQKEKKSPLDIIQ